MEGKRQLQLVIVFTVAATLLFPANSFLIGQVSAQEIPLTAQINEPLNGSITNSTNLVVNGTASGDNLDSVEILLNTIPQGNATLLGSIFTMDLTLVQGQYNITAVAKDTANNNATDSVQITIDTSNPTIVITSPSESVINSNTVTINGTASDNTGIQFVKVKIGDDPFELAIGTSEWSFETTLSNGNYTITAQATDLAGNVNTASIEVQILVDTQAPQVSITFPSNASLLNTSSVTITGTASDISGIASVQVSVDGEAFQDAVGTTEWSFETSLSNGNHTITAQATDLVGNTNTTSKEVTVDIQAPEVLITFPSNSSILNTSNVTINGTASDANGISLVEISIDGGAFQTAVGTTEWSFAAILGDGIHPVVARANDTVGNSNEDIVLFLIDTQPPTITISSPVNGALINSSNVTITGTAISDSGIGSVKVSIDGSQPVSASFNSTSGIWSFSALDLADGTHQVNATATDSAGNNVGATSSFIVDTLAPNISITLPVNGTTVTTPNVTISGIASDINGISSVLISIDNGAANTANFNSTSGNWSFQTILTNGNHTINATATDMVGNTKTISISIVVNADAPAVTITSPANGAKINSANVTLSGTASSGSSIESVKVSIDGIAALPASLNSTTGIWTFGPVTLQEGNHTALATVKDNANNTSSNGISFIVDLTAPVLTITSPSNNSTLTSSNVSISGTASDTDGISSVKVSIDGGSTFSLANGTLSWSFATTLANGNHTITAKATDMAGNTNSKSITVKVQAQQTTTTTTNTVQGLVFNDVNSDGTRQASETGIQGWTISLGGFDALTNQPMLLFTTTNVNGTYKFANLASGVYAVKPQTKEGATVTFPASGSYIITLPVSSTSFNFGIHLTAQSGQTPPGSGNGVGTTQFSNCVLRGKIVIDDATVTFNNCDIRGSLRIMNGSTVSLTDSSVRGNIKIKGGDLSLVTTELRGNIHAKNGFLSLEDESEIIGNVKSSNTSVTNDGTSTVKGKAPTSGEKLDSQGKSATSQESSKNDKVKQSGTDDSKSTGKSSSTAEGSGKEKGKGTKGDQDTEKAKGSGKDKGKGKEQKSGSDEKAKSQQGEESKGKGKDNGKDKDVGKSDKGDKGKSGDKSEGKGKGNDNGNGNGKSEGKGKGKPK